MSEDILERAKKAIIDDDMTYEDYDECISLLIAEVERLRSLTLDQQYMMDDLDKEIAAKDARIKELEADRIEARAQYLLFMNDNPGCIAWNFDELDETEQDALREQARHMLELEEPWAYVQLREARELIKRLEAAFLKLYVNQMVGCNMPREVADKHASEALERIKEGGKDDY